MRNAPSLAFLTTLLLPTSLAAQGASRDLAEAPSVRDYILITFREKPKVQFGYEIDGRNGPALSHPLPDLMTVTTTRVKGVNVLLEYLNPLKYAWEISEKASDDPTYSTAGQFLTSLQTLLSIVTPSTSAVAAIPLVDLQQERVAVQASKASAKDDQIRIAEQRNEKANAVEKLKATTKTTERQLQTATDERRTFDRRLTEATARVDSIERRDEALEAIESLFTNRTAYAPELVDWILQYSQRARCVDGPSAVSFVKALLEVDDQLFGTGQERHDGHTRTSTAYRDSAVTALQVLLGAGTIQELGAASKRASEVLRWLQGQNAAIERGLVVVGTTHSALRWQAPELECGTFRSYTAGKVPHFVDDARELLAKQQQVAKDLGALLTQVDAALVTDARENSFRVAQVVLPAAKMSDVTIRIRRRDVRFDDDKTRITIEDKSDISATFRVREKQSIMLDLGPSAVFTSIKYPTFDVAPGADGKSAVVAPPGEDIQRYSLVGMLSLTPNVGWHGLTHFAGQLGIGTGKELPIVLAGMGLRFTSPFDATITGGAAWHWRRAFRSLAPGDTVVDAKALEKDLSYHFVGRPRFYLGLQVGPQHTF